MENITTVDSFDRSIIENWVHRHIAAWEAGNVITISATLQPEVEFVLPTLRGAGRAQAQIALEHHLDRGLSFRLRVRRLLIDPVQRVAAIEWVCRYARPGENGCQEFLGGTTLDFDSVGLIWRWRTYLDPVRRRTLSDLEAPLPGEGWSPCPDPGPPPTPATVQQVIHAYAQAWSNHDLTQLHAAVHDEICVQPPWDYVVGRAALETGARLYFANYTDTRATPQRFILDPTQPHFGVCEQTFACTNPDTGQRGEDHDFAFFEIAQGKLRYWRTYFDTSRSVQVVEKTIGFVSQQSQS